MKTSIIDLPSGDVLVYKYGCRLDADCLPVVNEQISLARAMYNELVADIRKAVEARSAREIELGGASAQSLQKEIVDLTESFMAAKAANDESTMASIASLRKTKWGQMSASLKSVRAENKNELREYMSKIGKNSSCTTYQIRSQYVAKGLGWATANSILDSALQALQDSMKKGQAPRFAKGTEIVRDTLCLQFTAAGGVDATRFLRSDHTEFHLRPPKEFKRRAYGEFLMRMGAAKLDQTASGTWQAHRPIPAGASVAAVALVRDKVGTRFEWSIQLTLKLAHAMTADVNLERKPLAAIHLGWSAEDGGRRIGSIADAADAGLAKPINLPSEIEERLKRSQEIASRRDIALNEFLPLFKSIPDSCVLTWPSALQDEYKAIKRLPATYISQSSLHRFWWALEKADCISAHVEAFTAWRKKDKLEHQAEVGLARSARNARKTFYRTLALRQCQEYEAIALDKPDLKEAAKKVNETTGEKNELGAIARSGRVVAALYEYETALIWAAARCNTALIEVDGETASACSTCGHHGLKTVEGTQYQEQECPACGAIHDRKHNSASMIYQALCNDSQEMMIRSAELRLENAKAAAEKQRVKREKVLEARRKRTQQEKMAELEII